MQFILLYVGVLLERRPTYAFKPPVMNSGIHIPVCRRAMAMAEENGVVIFDYNLNLRLAVYRLQVEPLKGTSILGESNITRRGLPFHHQ